ncbi:homoserine O-succinyltransferase [Methylocystis echinoides]|uniref:homoserine O-acetyltransferase/O-succinyltransferase family protein n=1 Tax=Methylocystis echinoides TaxID=29468 RepID=UPI003438573A
MRRLKRGDGAVLEVAFVNNMPDAALSATEAQFARLVRAGAAGRAVRWRCYALPGLDRSEKARRYLARSHEAIEALYRRGADAVIVTGSEPRAERLEREPYWPHIQRLVDWAREHTRAAIWSCLAAHAATLHLSGIERRPETRKMSGVLQFTNYAPEWSGERAGTRIVPHSRCNGLDRDALERYGFQIGSNSDVAGVDMFWRREPSLFVFLQGHPEYDADTLAKEYRRDVLRFLDGAQSTYPAQPERVFDAALSARLDELTARIRCGCVADANRTLESLLAGQSYGAPWKEDAIALYRDWLSTVDALRKARQD